MAINTSSEWNNPPPAVMRSAIIPTNASQPISIPVDGYSKYVFYLYFAELVTLQPNQHRLIDVFVDDVKFYRHFNPSYLVANGLHNSYPIVNETVWLKLIALGNSTLPPILNAFEVYFVVNDDSSLTEQDDVDALQSIKSTYKILENWEGDPCGPKSYPWNRVTCSYANAKPPTVVSLSLSSIQLHGEIARELVNLKYLQTLDLSRNSLTGPVPSFLSQLSSLKVLNLSGNNLTGTIPDSLVARSKAGSLSLIVTGNPSLCLDDRCGIPTKKNMSKTTLILAVGGVLVALVVAAMVLAFACRRWKKRSKRQACQEKMVKLVSNARSLTHSSIVDITSNFGRVIGQGGSGKVYFGIYDGAQVAVKIVSTNDEYKQFQTEANHLLKVHHRNLTKLVGYCNEQKHLALVYEYMENGSLRDVLSHHSKVLNWK